jgi:glucose-1-phosphate adenylyltransferase
MDLISALPIFNLYNREWPIYTQTVNAPPAKFTRDAWGRAADVNEAIVGAGSVVQGASIVRSVVSPWCTVDAGATVSDAILFDQVHVGAGAVVRRAIIDKAVEIGPGVQIGVDHEADRARGFAISTSGIVTVGKGQKIMQ